MTRRATEAEIAAALAALPGWERRGETIWREFTFADFVAAFAFMTDVAAAAEQRSHHPDWRNVYRRVQISWTTHDAGGLTGLDFELARRCDELAAAPGEQGFA
ncbi:MAG: 4a-hydroxytetrahydrobiopterin dehydratase [Planctomycetes bacterium]|nr:4a-hydroxytetrahydrobiopterin dehydratase [Planctomycetota bacterium]